MICPSPINVKYPRFEVNHSRMSKAQRKPWDAAHITAQVKIRRKKKPKTVILCSCGFLMCDSDCSKEESCPAMHSSAAPTAQPPPPLSHPHRSAAPTAQPPASLSYSHASFLLFLHSLLHPSLPPSHIPLCFQYSELVSLV